MRRFVISIVCLVAFCLVISGAAYSQENPTGTLVGNVTDAQGGAIAGAKVTVTDIASGTSVSTQSGGQGEFTVSNLSPSVYKVTVEMKGFKTGAFTNIGITVGKTYSLPAKLEVGETTVTVQVEGGGEQLMETQSATVTNTVSGRVITQLPFNSRSAVLLGVLDPGAETSGGSRNSSFEGLPKGSINITFDGINVQCNLLKSSDGFFAINDPRIDDVEQFAITTGVNSPDKSGEGAVQMNYVSKRGGNAFHGGVWEYNRNTAFDSNDYFDNQSGTPRQTLQLNDYGGKVGGHIIRDKLFFHRGHGRLYVARVHYAFAQRFDAWTERLCSRVLHLPTGGCKWQSVITHTPIQRYELGDLQRQFVKSTLHRQPACDGASRGLHARN